MLTIGKNLCPSGKVDVLTEEETTEAPKDYKKMIICAIILIVVVICMALESTIGIPMQTVAVMGALACVLTGCLTEKQAYQGIDWVTIFLFAGMLPLAEAMDRSGAGKLIADFVVNLMGDNPSPMIIVIAMFILSCGLTQFMSNTAAAALLPIGISIAQSIGACSYGNRIAAFTTRLRNTILVKIYGLRKSRCAACVRIYCLIVIFFWPFYP